MKRTVWQNLLGSLPSGLTIQDIASRLGTSYRITAMRVREFGYQRGGGHAEFWTEKERRKYQKVRWSNINWKRSNAEIARRHGVSREVVRRRRIRYAAMD